MKNRDWYDRQTQKFADLAMSYPDTVAVYTGGTVSQPGISDLDFLVCLRDEMTEPFEIEGELENELRDAIGEGSVLKVNELNMVNVQMIDDFPLTHVSGRKFEFKKYDGELFELCRVFDWLPERLSTLRKLRARSGRDNVCKLQFLKSLTVSLRKLDAVAGSDDKGFCESVLELREQWFEKTQAERDEALADVMSRAEDVARGALKALDSWVTERKLIVAAVEDDYHWVVDGGPELTSEEIPVTVFAFLSQQAAFETGFVSEKVKAAFGAKGLIQDFEVAPELKDVMLTRMQYVESLADWFRRNGLTRGLLKFGWFLREYEQVRA